MTGQSGERGKFNAKAPGRTRTAKTLCLHSYCGTLLVTINHPNRQSVFNSASWRFLFASSRLGVAALVIHPIALAGMNAYTQMMFGPGFPVHAAERAGRGKSAIRRR
jgi:hypothetical protein